MPPPLARARAMLGLAAAQARHDRGRVLLAVVGVAVAVLLVTLLVGLGHGVTTRGAAALEDTNRDLWLSPPAGTGPATASTVDTRLLDAHATAHAVRTEPGVREAEAIAFRTVYVSADGATFTTVVGVGVTGTSAPLQLLAGPGFDRRDVHYAGGRYDGPMTRAVIVDQRLAERLDLRVGDALYAGGTLATARGNRFEVVGISPTLSSFVGTTTVTLHLSELQTVTGTTDADPASLVAVTVEPGADPAAVATALDRAYPEYRVRTNAEQFRAVVGRQAPVLASALALVGIALGTGAALVVAVLTRFVLAQEPALASLKAAGVSSSSLAGLMVGQGLLVGALGGAVGLATTPVAAAGVNRLVAALVGFEALIATPWWGYLLGGAVAIGLGTVAAAAAGWRVGRLDPARRLGGLR